MFYRCWMGCIFWVWHTLHMCCSFLHLLFGWNLVRWPVVWISNNVGKCWLQYFYIFLRPQPPFFYSLSWQSLLIIIKRLLRPRSTGLSLVLPPFATLRLCPLPKVGLTGSSYSQDSWEQYTYWWYLKHWSHSFQQSVARAVCRILEILRSKIKNLLCSRQY